MKKRIVLLVFFSFYLVTFLEPFIEVYANKVDGRSISTITSSDLSDIQHADTSSLSSNTNTSTSSGTSSESSTVSSDIEVDASSTSVTKPFQTSDEVTITFINANAIFKQSKVKKNEIVPYPAAPELQDGQVSFTGWYTAPEGGVQFDFKTPIQQSITLYAHFNTEYLIQYKDQHGTVIDSKEAKRGELTPKCTANLTPPVGEHFSYWYTEGDLTETPFNFDASKVSKNLVLVPKFSKERTILFISEGSQVDPEYIDEGSSIIKPRDPVRDGYTFSHWSTKENGSNHYDFNQPVSSDLTLYAVWIPKKVQYTIAYWMEKPNVLKDPGTDKSNYNFAWSTVKSDGESGKNVTVDKDLADRLKNADPHGQSALKYSTYSFSDSQIISGNGQTIINVYYKRNTYHVKFELKRSDAQMQANGNTFTGKDSTIYAISAKYGQDIESLWPNNPSVADKHYYFEGWKYPSDSTSSGNMTTGNPMTLTSNLISTKENKMDLTLTANYSASDKENVRKMYVESFRNSGEKFEDRYYDLFDTQKYYSSSSNYIEDPIYGFNFYKRESQDSYSGKYYYLRNKHTLTYNTQGGEFQGDGQTTTKKYEETIEPPAAPVREGYIFDGWYLDSDFREKVDFDKFTMPDSNETFFAKWESDQNTVRYFDSLGGNQLLVQGYADNEHVSFPSDYVKGETYIDGKGLFNGWFWQLGSSSFEFSDTIPVTHAIDLFAKWQTDNFHVSYDLGEGSGTTPKDETTYDLTTKALIKGSNDIVAPNGKVFIGWKSNKDAMIYYPEDHMQVKGDTKLTAVYASKDEIVHIIYHAGKYDGSPEDITQKAIKDSKVSLKGAIFERPGKTLIGWSTKVNGSKVYDLSATDIVIGSSDMKLYAVWENKKVNITFLPGDHGTLKYDGQSITTAVDYGKSWEDSYVSVPEPKSDSGYSFAGWQPVLPAADAELTRDYIFTAQFVEKAKGKITIRYVDETGKPIADEKNIDGTEGDAYDVSGPDYEVEKIRDYDLEKVPDNVKGTFHKENTLIVFIYKEEHRAGSGSVIVKYIDDEGNELHSSVRVNGTIGSPYDEKDSNIEIEGYHFTKTSGHLQGRFSEAPIYITHIYTKNDGSGKKDTSGRSDQPKPNQPNKENSEDKVNSSKVSNSKAEERKVVSLKREVNTTKKNNLITKTRVSGHHKHSKQYPKTGENRKNSSNIANVGIVLILGVVMITLLKKKDTE